MQPLLAVEAEADPSGVDARPGVLGKPELVRVLPSAVEQVIGSQPQAMAPSSVLYGVMSAEPGDVGIEAGPADHRRSPVDDPRTAMMGAGVCCAFAPFLRPGRR